ncbi:MAG: polysaccharide deacetylase family protein [Clostridia bacterium]|nr:polysaccharide deacetylase family protein [Clostridia bacterium]
MFAGKMKAVTFSFDDGVTQDKRLIEIFDKYGLKCTFNINSELLGKAGSLIIGDVTVAHVKPRPQEIKEIYKNHEVAVHTLTHPNLTTLDDAEVIRQVETDRKNLTEYVGYEVCGMAYPCGGVNNDERVAELIKKNSGVKYSRTITSTHNFDLQDNLYQFNPSVYILETDKMWEMAEEFLKLQTDTPKLFYIWGHAYEFDIDNSWQKFDDFCRFISNRDDIFYGTNSEVLLNK